MVEEKEEGVCEGGPLINDPEEAVTSSIIGLDRAGIVGNLEEKMEKGKKGRKRKMGFGGFCCYAEKWLVGQRRQKRAMGQLRFGEFYFYVLSIIIRSTNGFSFFVLPLPFPIGSSFSLSILNH